MHLHDSPHTHVQHQRPHLKHTLSQWWEMVSRKLLGLHFSDVPLSELSVRFILRCLWVVTGLTLPHASAGTCTAKYPDVTVCFVHVWLLESLFCAQTPQLWSQEERGVIKVTHLIQASPLQLTTRFLQRNKRQISTLAQSLLQTYIWFIHMHFAPHQDFSSNNLHLKVMDDESSTMLLSLLLYKLVSEPQVRVALIPLSGPERLMSSFTRSCSCLLKTLFNSSSLKPQREQLLSFAGLCF